MAPDQDFAGFDLDKIVNDVDTAKRIAEAERKRAEAEAKRLNGEAQRKNADVPKVVPAQPVLENIEFGTCSEKNLNMPDAVFYAEQRAEQRGILQSAGEAVYARKVLNTAASWDTQHTRTGAFYVVENDKPYVAFDDIADILNNVVTRYAVEAFRDNNENKEFLIRGSLLESVLGRAKDTKRFLEVPVNGMIGASFFSGNPSPYETNPYCVAIFGEKMVRLSAELAIEKQGVAATLHLLSAPYVEGIVNMTDKGIVRLVNLTHVAHLMRAEVKFNELGRARFVTYKPAGGEQ